MSPDDLRAWRIKNDLTISELAHGLGVGTATIERWEAGKAPMPDHIPLALAHLAAHKSLLAQARNAIPRTRARKGAFRGR